MTPTVDEDVHAVERIGHRGVHRNPKRVAAERVPEIATRGRPAHGRDELEVERVDDDGHEGAACPARRARNTHGPSEPSPRLRLDQLDPVAVRKGAMSRSLPAMVGARGRAAQVWTARPHVD